MNSRSRSMMRVAAAACAAMFLATPSLTAQNWMATLGPEVVGATGSGFATFSLSGNLFTINTSWTGLSGNTTVAHVHCCTVAPNTGTAGVAVTPGTLPLFPVGVTSGSYSVTVDLGLPATFTGAFVTNFGGGTVAGAKNALVNAFGNGTAYLNIHSSTFPGGEIRGFVTTVPEPSSVALLAFGLAALAAPAAFKRRRASR